MATFFKYFIVFFVFFHGTSLKLLTIIGLLILQLNKNEMVTFIQSKRITKMIRTHMLHSMCKCKEVLKLRNEKRFYTKPVFMKSR